jgi:F-type H+-transporting ATPase subunit epsilon
LAISGGFADVTGNEVTVLTSSAERAEEIDMNRAEAARKRAEERIAERGPELDLTRAQAALARALNRLAVAKQSQP